jgi:hypothetical protein
MKLTPELSERAEKVIESLTVSIDGFCDLIHSVAETVGDDGKEAIEEIVSLIDRNVSVRNLVGIVSFLGVVLEKKDDALTDKQREAIFAFLEEKRNEGMAKETT